MVIPSRVQSSASFIWMKITSPPLIETNDLLKKALLEKCYQDAALNLCRE